MIGSSHVRVCVRAARVCADDRAHMVVLWAAAMAKSGGFFFDFWDRHFFCDCSGRNMDVNNSPVRLYSVTAGVLGLLCLLAVVQEGGVQRQVDERSVSQNAAFAARNKGNEDGETHPMSQKSNIVVIMADDLGWNDIGYASTDLYGMTPTLDSMAKAGIKLSSYYSQHQCTPARGSLLTGKYPIHIGLQHEEVVQILEPWGLPTRHLTLPEVLSYLGGYRCHMIGKWCVVVIVQYCRPLLESLVFWEWWCCVCVSFHQLFMLSDTQLSPFRVDGARCLGLKLWPRTWVT